MGYNDAVRLERAQQQKRTEIVHHMMKTGNDYNVPLPATAVAHELFKAMIAAGRGDLDHSAIITVLEDLAGVQARTKEP